MSLRLLILVFGFLSIAACSSSSGRAPVSDITKKKNGLSQKYYIVQKGDTLYSISWRTGVDVDSLVERNQLKAPYIIKKGQSLTLTGGRSRNVGNTNNKRDLSSQIVHKNSQSACTAQNCNKNTSKEVAPKNTKAYSANKADTKIVNRTKQRKKNQKVSAWSWPVKGQLTKTFSAAKSGKQGISIVNKRGSSINATAPGKVVYAGSGLRGYGNLIIIKHNDDYLSAYAHNETLLVGENDDIKMGQKIAVMGDSGSDHVHLHFEIRYRGKSVDPTRYLPKR